MTGPEESAELLPPTSSERYPELHIISVDPLDIAAVALAKLQAAGHDGYIASGDDKDSLSPIAQFSDTAIVAEGGARVMHPNFTAPIHELVSSVEEPVPDEGQNNFANNVIDLEEYRRRQKDVLRGKSLYDHIRRAQNGDEKARERLWVDAQALAGWIVQRHPSLILEQEDQFQVCLEVVPGAIERFDFDRGGAYVSYLYRRMWGATIDAERASYRSRGVTRNDYKALEMAVKSDDANERLHQLVKDGFELAPYLVNEHQINTREISLDQLREASAEGVRKVLVEPVDPKRVEHQASYMFDVDEIAKHLAILSPNERYVVEQHLGLYGRQPRTMKEVGRDLGVTESRISQVFNKSLERMSQRIVNPDAGVSLATNKSNRLLAATKDRGNETRSQAESRMRTPLVKLTDTLLAKNEIDCVIERLDGWTHSVHEGSSGPVHVLQRSDVTSEQFDVSTIHINHERCKVGFMGDAFIMITKHVRGADLLNTIDIQQAIRANGFDTIAYDEEVRAQLTDRERGILADLWKPYKLIAHEQGIAVSTVRTHIHNMLDRFNLRNCEELIIFGARKGLISLRDVPEGRTDNLKGRPRQILKEHYPTSTYEEIAQAYSISVATARVHIHKIFKVTQAQTSHQITLMALRDGIIPL